MSVTPATDNIAATTLARRHRFQWWEPLPWLKGAEDHPDRPGLLLVTPAVPISTPAAFRAWDAGARIPGGAARLASAHLADELRRGLRLDGLMARASVLAAANDLAPAAAAVEPALVPFKRALLRLLARPVGLSGSGPTNWALYASLAEAAAGAERLRVAVEQGQLAAPGRPPPFIHATTILAPAPRREP